MASLEHRVMLDVSPQEADVLLNRGWRHFGPTWFRPVCRDCQACVATRILASEFVPSTSQQRARRRAAFLRPEVGEPMIDRTRVELFHTWQRQRAEARGWDKADLDEKDYFMQFAFPTSIAREVAYYDDRAGGRLVMVAICDETPLAWNAVFCFYDPAYHRISPGLASVVKLVDLARAGGHRYVHVGYLVADCQSLRYKAAFHPQEALSPIPTDDEAPRWVRAVPAAKPWG